MGYTHYWRRLQVLDAHQFEAWTQDVQHLVQSLPEHTTSAGGYYSEEPLSLAGWDGTGEPEITKATVSLNGAGDELSHETFLVERVYTPEDWEKGKSPEKGMWFAFCKTARKPYDLLVTAALIRLKYRLGGAVEVSSDGWAEDWAEGLQLCTRVFGGATLPFTEEEAC